MKEDGEATQASTAEFPRNHMAEFHVFIERALAAFATGLTGSRGKRAREVRSEKVLADLSQFKGDVAR